MKKKYTSRQYKPSEISRKNTHIVFIICILIASFFWLTIKLSDDYIESFQFKVSYNNIPAEKMLSGIIDTSIIVTIRAKGFQMLKLILTEDLESLNINLESYKIINLDGNVFYISTDEIKDNLGKLMGTSAKYIDISNKRLDFKLENLFEKEVKVENKIKFQFAQQYDLYDNILINPNKIKIFGPKSIINSIESVFTEERLITDISTDIDETVKLTSPNSNVQLSINQVNIKANVEKFTESKVELVIDLNGINYKIKAFPHIVKVFFTVAQKDFSKIRQNHFKVKPNLRNIDILEAGKLQLEVVEKPEFVSGIRIQPSEIEFLIIN